MISREAGEAHWPDDTRGRRHLGVFHAAARQFLQGPKPRTAVAASSGIAAPIAAAVDASTRRGVRGGRSPDVRQEYTGVVRHAPHLTRSAKRALRAFFGAVAHSGPSFGIAPKRTP